MNSTAIEDADQYFTLLGVRPDGVASVVDLVAAADLMAARRQATALLAEHKSCSLVEVWRGGPWSSSCRGRARRPNAPSVSLRDPPLPASPWRI